jgi:hypothetical protein
LKARKDAQGDPNGARTYLKVPFDAKDHAKQHGARWDADKKQWYHTHEETPAELRRYLPPVSAAAPKPKASPKAAVPAPAVASVRPVLPSKGRVSEDDPAIWGSWLLGHEGELWSQVRQLASGR